MKAQLLHFFTLLLPCAAVAQFHVTPEVRTPVQISAPTFSPQTNMMSEWYNYGETMGDSLSGVGSGRTVLGPDSTYQMQYSTGFGKIWLYGTGSTFDPSSPMFNYANTVLSNSMPYTVDSIAIIYRYVRFQHDYPDTLLVQYYKINTMQVGVDTTGPNTVTYAVPHYDYTTNSGLNAVQTQKFLLTASEVTTSSYRLLPIHCGISLAPGEKLAATVSYIAGNTLFPGDTLDPYTSVIPVNRRNGFLCYIWYDTNSRSDDPHVNNMNVVAVPNRYNISTLGWNGIYMPGSALDLTRYYYGDFYFRVTYDADLLGIHHSTVASPVNIAPNPATDRLFIRTSETIVRTEIIDAQGRVVQADQNAAINEIGISGISPGYYFLKVYTEKGEVSISSFVKQ